MKTNDLKMKLSYWGYDLVKDNTFNELRVEREDRKYITTYEHHNCLIQTHNSLTKLPDFEKEVLLELVSQYALTPIEKRNEPERYYYRIYGLRTPWKNYINYKKETDELFLSTKDSNFEYQTQFTDEEIEQFQGNQRKIFRNANREAVIYE